MQVLNIYQNKDKVIATLYENQKVIFTTEKVAIGRGGLISSKDKKEGDGCTPIGIYSIVGTFGANLNKIKKDAIKRKITIISGLSHLQIEEPNKCYWVDDPQSYYYNTMQWALGDKTNNWKSAEDLYNELYKYALILDYNKDCISGKGSAIFIHVARKDLSPTAGCIAFLERDLNKLISKLKKDVKIYIGVKDKNKYNRIKF